MAPTLSRGLVGYLPSPRRTGSPRSRVRLSELTEPEFEATLIKQADHLPRYATKTLLHSQLPSSTEVEEWQREAAVNPPDPLVRQIDVACSIYIDPLKGALKANHLTSNKPQSATTQKRHQIDTSAAEVGPVRAKQLALRAAGISSRPVASIKKQQQAIETGVMSELHSAQGNDDEDLNEVWSERASERNDDD